ncbi:MAG: nitroreductase family protein [Bacteroidia bacterium]|nr:nitroreductase family protein [Bacteroidia bacterium]
MNPVFSRRSIRKYTDQPLTDEQIRLILDAGMCAPSAGNQQPWHFVVVKDKLMLQKMSEVSPYADMVSTAPLAIMVCGNLNSQKYPDYWMIDCSAATENMLIEIASLGLGAVWIGVYPKQERTGYLKKLFQLPDEIIPLCIVPVGYPAEHKEPADRFDPAKVHYEKW